jgi:hypothetical protein
MPTYDPAIHYPPHEQDNPYFVQQHGYLERPHPKTLELMQAAIDRVAALPRGNSTNKSRRRPFNVKNYNKSRPVVYITRKTKGHPKAVSLDFIKCGPSYFPVSN